MRNPRKHSNKCALLRMLLFSNKYFHIPIDFIDIRGQYKDLFILPKPIIIVKSLKLNI